VSQCARLNCQYHCVRSSQFQHGASLLEPALHVPMGLLGPDIGPTGTAVDGLRSLLDIAPTVIHWLGARIGRGGNPLRTGISLISDDSDPGHGGSGRGERARASGHQQLAFASFFDPDHLALRIDASLKLVVDLRSGSAELFDVLADPAEAHDIINTGRLSSGEVSRYVQQLRRWKQHNHAVMEISRRHVTRLRQQAVKLAYAVSAGVLQALGGNGFYEPSPAHGGLTISPYACRPCYSLRRDVDQNVVPASPPKAEFAFVPCDVDGVTQSWSLALRFTAFDAVLYRAARQATTHNVTARTSVWAATMGAPKGPDDTECPTLPLAGWSPVGAAYFRFGDLDAGTIQTFRSMR
jgi:hypothetical protein